MTVFGIQNPGSASAKIKFVILLLIIVQLSISEQISAQPRCTNFTDLKWLQFGGVVKVRYAFHKNLENDQVVRGVVQEAIEIFEETTCTEWMETNITDPCHKIVILEAKDCGAILDYKDQKGVLVLLHPGCYRLGIVLHEMTHALGIRHTHQRLDRDDYITVWNDNIKLDYEASYEIYRYFNSYGVPYDYQSIMHYGITHFSRNGEYTMTSKDPYAIFAMGKRQNDLRWSDAAMINHHLDCVDHLPATCGYTKGNPCKNHGYLVRNCECSCPENTRGRFCEKLTRAELYDENVKCGRIIRTDQEFRTDRFRTSRPTFDPCVFHLISKKCYEPHIKFQYVDMPGRGCSDNILVIETPISLSTNCWARTIPVGRSVNYRHSRVVISYHQKLFYPRVSFGFVADVMFKKNTTWPRRKERSESRGECFRSTSRNKYVFRTPYFPYPVRCFAECSETFTADVSGNKKGFMILYLTHRLIGSDILTIKDRNFLWDIKNADLKLRKMVVQMPVTVTLNGGDDPGKGFKTEMTSGYAEECEGKTFIVNDIGIIITNPIFNKKELSNCYFQVKALRSNILHFNLQYITGDELFLGTKDGFSSYSNSYYNIVVNYGSVLLYYEPQGERKNWKLTVTLRTCYWSRTGLCSSPAPRKFITSE